MPVVTHSGEHEDSTTAEVTADALDPLIGQTIDGRFRIVDVIGKGAMGKVYRAVQLPLNRAVAIKLLDSRYGAGKDETFKQRFLVEAALTSKLNHPNTVRVLDYGSTRDGLFFLAMEYLDGETLEKVLTKGALPWHRVLGIGQQMARALREAHELGVVHRDLKPGNVVLLHADDDADFVKVLDFGLVKSFVEGHELEGRAITQQGMLVGSPPYMAPEQGEKNRADPRSDIYSLGTMLFEMLSGKPPFTGGGALEVILKHVNAPVPPLVAPSKFEPVPEALAGIVLKCLAKSPMDRFQSMDELLIALQDVSVPSRSNAPEPEQPKTEVAVALTPSPMELPLPAPAPRGPSVLLVAGFFLAAVAGVLGTWTLVKPAPPTKLVFHVESTPPGASVIVEGHTLGVTPIDLEQVLGQGSRATMEMRLEKDGYSSSTVRLTGGGGRLEVIQTLTPLPVKAEEPRKAEPVVKPQPKPEPVKAEVKPEPVVAKPEPVVAKPEPVVAKPEPVVAKPEPVKKPEPVVAKPEPVKKPEPVVARPEPVKKAEPEPVKNPKHAPTRPEPKKKAASAAPPAGPRPASKLDEEDETAPTKSELKRPTAQQ